MTSGQGYVLAGNMTELERVRLQSLAWQPAAERLLDAIGIREGWRCADLGCGPVGIVSSLSRRVGNSGQVIGADIDPKAIEHLREHASAVGLTNVEFVQDDAYDSKLGNATFDLVHVRYVFSPVGRHEELMRSLLALARPGGKIVAQETDTTSWKCIPGSEAWFAAVDLIRRTFLARGGDFDSGQRIYSLFRSAGLKDVEARAEVLCPRPEDPYRRIPILFLYAMRDFIVKRELATAAELDHLIAECEKVAADPERLHMTFTTVQVWGSKPE
jgi:ubiquinone/menaquinone biosynthesis C-methylase UbiE